MDSGIDSPVDCTKLVEAIKAANVTFVGRYYRNKNSKWAKLTASEAQTLSSAGLQIVALWEGASDNAKYFSYAAGVSDSTSAYVEAMSAGQTARTPIYFAVDFDASAQDIAGSINDYFAGIAAGYQTVSHGNPSYDVGVYGSGATCAWLLGHSRVTKTWLAMSGGWAGSQSFDAWNIKQGKGLGNLNFDQDSDVAKSDFGGFQIA
jgi:hypothetical protein